MVSLGSGTLWGWLCHGRLLCIRWLVWNSLATVILMAVVSDDVWATSFYG